MQKEIERAVAEYEACAARFRADRWWGNLLGAMDWRAELKLMGYDCSKLTPVDVLSNIVWEVER